MNSFLQSQSSQKERERQRFAAAQTTPRTSRQVALAPSIAGGPAPDSIHDNRSRGLANGEGAGVEQGAPGISLEELSAKMDAVLSVCEKQALDIASIKKDISLLERTVNERSVPTHPNASACDIVLASQPIRGNPSQRPMQAALGAHSSGSEGFDSLDAQRWESEFDLARQRQGDAEFDLVHAAKSWLDEQQLDADISTDTYMGAVSVRSQVSRADADLDVNMSSQHSREMSSSQVSVVPPPIRDAPFFAMPTTVLYTIVPNETHATPCVNNLVC